MTAMQPSRENKKRRRGRKSSEDATANGESVSNYQAHKTPLIRLDEEGGTWYEYGKNLPGRDETTATLPPQHGDQPNHTLVSKYRALGDMIFQKEIQLVGRGASSDERWVENTMKKGTLKDRIAAMSVTVSSDPIHKFYALDGLLAMVGCSESGGKTNSRVAQLTAEALEDLWLNNFLPPTRKLMSLSQRPLYKYEPSKNGKKSKKSLSPRILLLWRFEEMVQEKFNMYLSKYMSQTLQDGAEMQKTSILQSAATILSSVPEGESTLLSMLVNKIGDPGKKTASAAGHQLRIVLQQHPNMQLIVAREVQQLAHRPGLSPRALYNCIVFLNQLKLTKEDEKMVQEHSQLQQETLAASLVKTYFRLFEIAVKKGKEKDPESEEAGVKSRLLSALLTGVNRAHPYLPEKDKDMEEHIDALYRVVHTAAPAACTQALMLLFHLAVGSEVDGEEKEKAGASQTVASRKDRFYRALYATLSKPSLVSTGKHLTMYFNVLYKAMKYDSDINRVLAFAKRLMCTVLHSNPAPIAGSIFLLNEIAKTHNRLRSCMEEAPIDSDALVFLNDSKRDPRSAFAIQVTEGKDQPKSPNPPTWELSLIAHHYHPSVAKFAGAVGEIEYAGDPLRDFGLAPFLDKFAYRNPKSRDKVAGQYKRKESVAERRSGTDGMIRARLELPMNDPAFLEREDVDEQDEFFQKYFAERARRDELKGITRNNKAALDDEEMEEAEEEALDAAEEADGLDTGKTFEEYERAWETDEEEEAFVDTLAQKLMEEEAGGPVDFDDEDPDMDDWGDMYSDTEIVKKAPDVELEGGAESSDDSEMQEQKPDHGVDESDSGIDDDSDDDEEEADIEDEDAFMDANDTEDSDDEPQDEDSDLDEDEIRKGIKRSPENAHNKDSTQDSDSENDLAFLEGEGSDDSGTEESDDDEEDDVRPRKKNKSEPTFADADEYLDMINTSFNDLISEKIEDDATQGGKGVAKKKRRSKSGRK